MFKNEERLVVLEDDFDPNDLQPGYYTAYSDTESYPTLWGMVNTGWASDEGVRFLEGGVVQMAAALDMPPLVGNPEDEEFEEAMVVIPHSSFTKVVNDYRKWRQMWWREVIQNSIDAGASKIDCRVEEQADGTWLVSCKDNGCGMSYDTLMNAFFTVGGTDKPSYAHGGFGEAKKLIVLAWIKYAVTTRDIMVEGIGAEFPRLRVFRDQSRLNGTMVQVVMPADKHTTESAAIEYISRCQLSGVTFFVNGTPIKANLRRGSKKRDLPMGAELFYNKNVEGISALIVRSNGLYMFDHSLSTDFEGIIVVEVHPRPKSEGGPSVEDLFLSNRMGFQYGELRQIIEKVFTQAEFDIKQALRSPDALFRKKYKGTGYFTAETARNREAIVRTRTGPLPEVSSGNGLEMTSDMKADLVQVFNEFEQQAIEEAAGDATTLISVVSSEEADIMLGMNFKGESHLESIIQQMVWQPDFININDETTRDNFRLDKKFDPSTMTGPVYALARLWAAFVRFILIQKGSNQMWGVGFIFSTESQGMFHADNEGGKWVVFNPINLSTNKLMSIRNKGDVRKIFEVAMHECAHLLGGTYHGDAFVKAFDSIVTEMLEHWNVAKRIAKNIKVRGVIKRDRRETVPETTQLIVTPVTEQIAHVMVMDAPSIRILINELNLNERQLEFYLEESGLDNFLWKVSDEAREMWDEGKTFTAVMSYPWVRRELSRLSKQDAMDSGGVVIPVRVTVSHDGTIFLEPANTLHRNYFRDNYGDISDVSTRVIFVEGTADQDFRFRKLFFDNIDLGGWPYTETGLNPSGIVNILFTGGSVTIPLDRSLYHRVLDETLRDEPEFMNRDTSIALNVGRTSRGTYLMHPSNRQHYLNYARRFDTGESFQLELTRRRSIEQLVGQFASWNITELDEGYATEVIVPTRLFERWLYDNELRLRRSDWAPVMPEDVEIIVENKVSVLVRNLGKNIVALEFVSPSDWGTRVAGKYGIGLSELTWYAEADKFVFQVVDTMTDTQKKDLLGRFWKQCSPGSMIVEMDGAVFEAGLDSQRGVLLTRPFGSLPVWLLVNNMDFLVIRPVLSSHERYYEEETKHDPTVIIKDEEERMRLANQVLQSTYNCGATPAGVDAAQQKYADMDVSGRPVLAAMLASDFFGLFMGLS